MLYDHSIDPMENVNISERPENKKIVKKMSTMIQELWVHDKMNRRTENERFRIGAKGEAGHPLMVDAAWRRPDTK